MFSKGQLVFAVFFFIAFVSAMIVMYRRDRKEHKAYFKGSYKILIGFIVGMLFLFLIKILTQK